MENRYFCCVCGEQLGDDSSGDGLCDICNIPAKTTADTQRMRSINRQYNLGYVSYTKMYEEQDGVCWICGVDLAMYNDGSGTKVACVDHDHDTGEVRGLLCKKCNIGIGMFNENIGRLICAANYLKRFK